MRARQFGRTGRAVSEIGLGTWGIGGAQWAKVDEGKAVETLKEAMACGVTFLIPLTYTAKEHQRS